MKKIAVGFLLLLALVAQLAFGVPISVFSSKHNLSSSGTGSIKSTSESQVCVFCHTPHGASTIAQLWNRLPTAATYTLYTSPTLTGLAYPAGAQPTAKSKLCLSCHDGTVAIGSVYNLPGPGGGPGTIPNMQNTTGGLMPTTRAGYLGTSLTDDHPVGYLYQTAKDPELVPRPWPWVASLGAGFGVGSPTTTASVRLDPDASTGTVECLTCHDPHNNENTKFMRLANQNALCTYCHNKTNYVVSGHATSTQVYTPLGSGTATTVGAYSCVSCHKPHGALGTPLLRGVEENTCYDAGCHGTNNAWATNTTAASGTTWRNIMAEMAKTHAHPTNTVSGLHKDLPFAAGTGAELPTQLGTTNRHAECPDCHNPHQVQPAVAAEKSTRGALRISLSLKGTWGVQPTWPAPSTTLVNDKVAFATGETYTVLGRSGTADVNPVTDEYQVCMKCHSNYVTLPVGARNIAQEINPNNSSYHGIVPCPATVVPSAPLWNTGCNTNFYVNSVTMVAPWAGTGTFTTAQSEACRLAPGGATCVTLATSRGRVWCSDCHGSDLSTMPPVAGTKTAPYGAHGSTNNGIVVGTSNSDRMLVRSIASATGIYTPLCLGCHKATSYSAGATGSRMSSHAGRGTYATYGCFTCHMWESANAVTGASDTIYPHGMNKRWTTIGTTATAGSLQMVDAFVGGASQTNGNYATKQCWTAANISGGTVACGRTAQTY